MYASTACSQPGMARAGDGTRVTSRLFTAPHWPLALSDSTHTCDVTAIVGPSLVYQYKKNKERIPFGKNSG